MNKYYFNIDKIAEFLKIYKDDLPKLYNWKAKIERLVDLSILTEFELKELNGKVSYEREIILKKKINIKLHEFHKINKNKFYDLCLWIIKDWGGILAGEDLKTIDLINEFLESDSHNYNRIASTSKVGAYMYPEKYIIYDSRVAYSLNWIILSRNAGEYYFPIPSGRNSKMMAFDMNVLIRLKNLDHYSPIHIGELDNRLYVNNKDKSKYIPKSEAYSQLNYLIKEVSLRLWETEEAKTMLYYTEMLLFSIADREVYMDISKKLTLNLK